MVDPNIFPNGRGLCMPLKAAIVVGLLSGHHMVSELRPGIGSGLGRQLTGTGRFIEKVEAVLGKRIEHRSGGRPLNMRKDSHEHGVK